MAWHHHPAQPPLSFAVPRRFINCCKCSGVTPALSTPRKKDNGDPIPVHPSRLRTPFEKETSLQQSCEDREYCCCCLCAKTQSLQLRGFIKLNLQLSNPQGSFHRAASLSLMIHDPWIHESWHNSKVSYWVNSQSHFKSYHIVSYLTHTDTHMMTPTRKIWLQGLSGFSTFHCYVTFLLVCWDLLVSRLDSIGGAQFQSYHFMYRLCR